MTHTDEGHSVLAVPVPALEWWVRARHAHYDAAYVSSDDAFVHAHVTLLSPWLDEPTAGDLDRVARLLERCRAFDFELAELGEFPDGTLHLRPEPARPFADLTAALVEQFPQCVPYDGRFAPTPHLTLDLAHGEVSLGSVRRALGDRVPVTTRAERVDLQWWAPGGCRRLASWELAA